MSRNLKFHNDPKTTKQDKGICFPSTSVFVCVVCLCVCSVRAHVHAACMCLCVCVCDTDYLCIYVLCMNICTCIYSVRVHVCSVVTQYDPITYVRIVFPIVGPMHHVRWQSEESDEDFSSNVEPISSVSPEFDAVRHQVLTLYCTLH